MPPFLDSARVRLVRGGRLSDDLVYICVTANGTPIRYFPTGPKGDAHVMLAIVEQHLAGVRLDVCLAAPRGLVGSVVVDVGFIELEAGG